MNDEPEIFALRCEDKILWHYSENENRCGFGLPNEHFQRRSLDSLSALVYLSVDSLSCKCFDRYESSEHFVLVDNDSKKESKI